MSFELEKLLDEVILELRKEFSGFFTITYQQGIGLAAAGKDKKEAI